MIGMASILLFLLIGIAAGISAGLFGIGGGVIIVPALIYLAGFSQHSAVGTSLAILLPPVGLAAVIEFYRHGHVDIKVGLLVALGLFLGAWLGAFVANKLSGAHLRLYFGLFVILLGVYIVYNSMKKLGAL
ncbi:MAG: sulfite exporter TauE/SafE family protein [Desulfomonilia bacterium]